jgi:hypothetical protein
MSIAPSTKSKAPELAPWRRTTPQPPPSDGGSLPPEASAPASLTGGPVAPSASAASAFPPPSFAPPSAPASITPQNGVAPAQSAFVWHPVVPHAPPLAIAPPLPASGT